MSKDVSKDLECRRVSKDVSLERLDVSLDVSKDVSKDISLDVSKDGYVVFQAYYNPLLVLVCRSVSQDPPRPIEDITVASAFLYSLSTALSQSAVAYVHVASGRPISDRLSPDTAVQRAKRSIVRLA